MSSVRGVHVPGTSSAQKKAISYGPQQAKATKPAATKTPKAPAKSGRKGK